MTPKTILISATYEADWGVLWHVKIARPEAKPEIAMTVVLPAVVCDGVVDVSHHNGAIDWPAVAGARIALAFIKATQGVGFVDPAFESNRNAAVNAGILVVPYHFLDTADPDEQAGHFLDVPVLAAAQP